MKQRTRRRKKRRVKRWCVPTCCPQSWPTRAVHGGLQLARLLCPWDSPGKDTGVGCHFLLQKSAYSSLCHTVGPCSLSILHLVVCVNFYQQVSELSNACWNGHVERGTRRGSGHFDTLRPEPSLGFLALEGKWCLLVTDSTSFLMEISKCREKQNLLNNEITLFFLLFSC